MNRINSETSDAILENIINCDTYFELGQIEAIKEILNSLVSEDETEGETEGWLCHECAKKLDYVVEEKEIARRMYNQYLKETTERIPFRLWLGREDDERV
jgi:hypothetical protein